MWWARNVNNKHTVQPKMCITKNLLDVLHSRTFLLIIVLASLKLCSPQDFTEEFAANDGNTSSELEKMVQKKSKVTRNSGSELPCRLSELLCDTGQCISLDKYCNGEDDCGDKSDEPKGCTRKLYLFWCRSALSTYIFLVLTEVFAESYSCNLVTSVFLTLVFSQFFGKKP